MELVLIRHGTTSGNQTHRHQPEYGRLTKEGRAEAAALAEYVTAFNPTVLLSSTHVRALETAAIISQDTDMIPSTSALFTELHRPQYMYGQFHRSWHTCKYLAGWYLGRIGTNVTTDVDLEGESYLIFQARVSEAARVLEAYPRDTRIAVVTHAVFISFLIHYLTTGHRVRLWHLPQLLINIFTIKNGSATALRYDKATGHWHKVAYHEGGDLVE